MTFEDLLLVQETQLQNVLLAYQMAQRHGGYQADYTADTVKQYIRRKK
jgi:hypothetical protein